MSSGGEDERDDKEGRQAPEDDVEDANSVRAEKSKDLIGQNLRKVYDEVADEPLPSRFVELLEQLKKGGK